VRNASNVEPEHSCRQVALLSPYDGGNLGDTAIQEALIANLCQCNPQLEICGITLDPAHTSARHQIPCYSLAVTSRPHYRAEGNAAPKASDQAPRSSARTSTNSGHLFHPVRAIPFLRWPKILLNEVRHVVRSYRLLRRIQLLVIAGGGQLDDEWGGSWGHPYALAKWSTLARLAGSEVVFLSVGACRTNARLTRLFLKRALSCASYRSYRDAESRRLALVMTPQAEGPVVPDLAFSLPSQASEERIRRGPTVHVGVSPIAFCHPDLWPTKSQPQFDRYVGELANFVGRILQDGASVSLFSSCPPDDQVFSHLEERLDSSLAAAVRVRLTRSSVTTLEDLLGVLRSVDLVVASRLHGLMLSFLCGKPALALSYDRKVTCLMEDMGQTSYCLDIQSFDSEDLFKSFCMLRANRDIVAPAVMATCSQYKAALQQQFRAISQLLTEHSVRRTQSHAHVFPQRNS
jgi:polysaccharide pyruvyl transferase WcaK-like protein